MGALDEAKKHAAMVEKARQDAQRKANLQAYRFEVLRQQVKIRQDENNADPDSEANLLRRMGIEP